MKAEGKPMKKVNQPIKNEPELPTLLNICEEIYQRSVNVSDFFEPIWCGDTEGLTMRQSDEHHATQQITGTSKR